MSARRFALTGLCGMVVVGGWLATELAGFGSPSGEFTEFNATPASTPFVVREAAPVGILDTADALAAPTATDLAADRGTTIEAALPEPPAISLADAPAGLPPEAPASSPAPASAGSPVEAPAIAPPAAPPVQVAMVNPSDLLEESSTRPARPVQSAEECAASDACIDQYLWSLYERAPKVDTIKERHQVKATVKKKGKTRTVTKTVTKLVDENFAWKDPKAAERFGLPLVNYVIGGMDRNFKLRLYRMLRAMDDAGLEPAITSAFRDNYRQALARGNKAAEDSSFHGGSRRGGYGHGLAADIVSVKGATRVERWRSSEALWKWVDVHGKEFGIGRPYLDRDAPHVAPIDGEEYAMKRGAAKSRLASLKKAKVAAAKAKKLQIVGVKTTKPHPAAVAARKPQVAAAKATTPSGRALHGPATKPAATTARAPRAKNTPARPASVIRTGARSPQQI